MTHQEMALRDLRQDLVADNARNNHLPLDESPSVEVGEDPLARRAGCRGACLLGPHGIVLGTAWTKVELGETEWLGVLSQLADQYDRKRLKRRVVVEK